MAALINRKSAPSESRDEIPPGTLYLLVLKTLAVRGRLHGYEIAESIQQGHRQLHIAVSKFQRIMGAISRVIQTA